MKTQVQAFLSKAMTLADNTLRLQFDCQELPSETMTEMFELRNKVGHLFFLEQPIKEIDTKDLPEIVLDKNEKSPSTRLRNVLFLLHKQNGGADHDFDAYYRKQIERVIETIKEKLN